MTRRKKKAPHTEFHTLKRIDNSRLVRLVEPTRQRELVKTAGLGVIVAAFLMMYVYQHFRCIDLSFQLEDLRTKQTQLAALNSELRLEIAGLRDPRRIDLIARRRLGLTEALPTQVQQYEGMPSGAELASLRYVRATHAR